MVLLLSLPAPDQNLLQNPELLDGIFSPTGWSYNASAGNRVTRLISADGAHRCVRLQGSGRDWAGLSSSRVPVEAGDVLTVGALLRALPGDPGESRDRLFVRFFGGPFLGQEGPSLEALGAEWMAVVGEVTAPQGADSADLSLQVRSGATVEIVAPVLLRGSRPQDARSMLSATKLPTEGWRELRAEDLLPPDTDGNGLPDGLEKWLGITPEDGARSARRTREQTTSLQTPTGYREDNDLKVDRIIIAGNSAESIASWAAMGYEPQVMVGFRAGAEWLQETHNGTPGSDEVQTDSRGQPLTCGPGSYYMVPTQNRRELFRRYFAEAVARGARAACPEEPEFFSNAGYSPAFRREWRDFYGEPWEDQAGSVEARYRSDRLKVALERRLLQACYAGARSVDPAVPRYLLAHSPLSYTAWGIVFGHHDAIATGEVDAMIAQVWTGTARTPITYAGDHRERTFENAYLEYASCVGLVRDLPIELWFLMDPLEDNPDRAMEDYHVNYERTLAAALMFPEVTHYETMPWPTRIFGRVPDGFATEICSVINALSDMQNQTAVHSHCGPEGIGTFLSDSAMWQRGAPHRSDLDCFYGVALPLLMRGIPVEVPHLDRAVDPGYLDRYRLLFVSYDFQKPMEPEINQALADWARRGGCLVLLGGEDPYNAVPAWWQERGFASPQDHLLSLCGLDVSGRTVTGEDAAAWTTVARTDYTGRDLGNETVESIDLAPFLGEGRALVRFEDSLQEDGWGALIRELTVSGTRDGRPVTLHVRPGSDEERELIAADDGSSLNPDGFRFCDGDRSVTYGFRLDPGTPATLAVRIGNQYLIRATSERSAGQNSFAAMGAPALGAAEIALPPSVPVVHYQGSGAEELYRGKAGALLSQKAVGDGWVLHFGAPGSWFSRSPQSANQLRALCRYVMEEHLGQAYREQGYLRTDRGRYTVARTFDEGLTLAGRFVNVLDPALPVVDGVELAPDGLAVLRDVAPDMAGDPSLLFASSCVEWSAASAQRVAAILSGASGTMGTCRVFTGGRTAAVEVLDAQGREVAVEAIAERETLLLRYPNRPFGLAVEVRFEEG